jgi:hypothetical protein
LTDKHYKWLEKETNPDDSEVGIIRHSGDLVAHYTEKILKSQLNYSANASNSSSLYYEKEWIDKEKSYDILRNSIEIIICVNKKYKESNDIN